MRLKTHLISNKQKPIKSFGSGIPFNMPSRYDVLTNDFERQKPIYIELSDLNNSGYGMPNNFTSKRGRVLPSINKYWTSNDFADAVNRARDIE